MDSPDLTHQHLDSRYEASIARQFARYALSIDYDDLPDEVIHQAKRVLLDTLGCAIGALNAPGSDACRALVKQLGGKPEATVFGSGVQTNAANAALVNSYLVRYLDYNDTGGGGHNSDSVPGILAIAERENASGEELLTSIVVSYELGARVVDACGGYSGGDESAEKSMEWIPDFRAGLNMPPAIGRLLGLSESQIANAIGCCASRNFPLGILDAHREEGTNTKNLRFGSIAYDAILSCMLAKEGFTGPVRVVEGDAGIDEVLFDGTMNFDPLIHNNEWRILDTSFKKLCANHTSHGHIYATISIVENNELQPEDIEAVRIKTGEREVHHTFNPVKMYPRNGETANHSGYYATAYAIKERAFGPDSHNPENFSDPVILDLIDKISVDVDSEMPGFNHSGTSEIVTKDGEEYTAHKSPPGFGEPALSDKDLEEKFTDMASAYMTDAEIQTVFDTIWDLESISNVGEITSLMEIE